MRHIFRLLLLVLVLVIVALISALTAMRFAIHGREVAIPKLVGLSPVEAERKATANGLLLQVENHFYSSEVPEGRIMSQLPEPGTTVRRGWRVRVAESLGPQRVTIPDVVGQSSRAAEMNLARRGLQVGSVAIANIPGVPPEQVVAQNPPANAEGISSPKVNLLTTPPQDGSPQAYVMPDFTGHTLAEATKAVTDAGFKLGSIKAILKASNGSTANNNLRSNGKPLPSDVVASQTPAAGQKILSGSTISFEVTKN